MNQLVHLFYMLLLGSVLLFGIRRPGSLLAMALCSWPIGELLDLPFLTATVLILALLVGLSRRNSVNLLLTLTAIDISFLCFLIFLAASSLWSPDLKTATSYVLTVTSPAIIFYVVAKLIFGRHHSSAIAAQLFYTLVFVVLAFCPLALMETEWLNGRLFLNGSDAFSIGVTQPAVATTALSLYALRNSFLRESCTKIVLYAGLFASIILIGFTGSRGALLAAVLALIVYFCSTLGPRGVALGVVCFAGVSFGLVFSSSFKQLVSSLSNSDVRFLAFDAYLQGASVRERLFLYQSALDIGRENLIIGAGAGSFQYKMGGSYPHNLFLEIFVSMGLIGLLLFVLFLIFAFINYKAVVRRAPGVVVLGIIAIFALFQMQFSFSLAMAKPLFFLGGISGILVSRRRLRRGKEVQFPTIRTPSRI